MEAASPRRQTFRKLERLASRKALGELIEKGRVIQDPPFRLTWLTMDLNTTFPIQIAFSVPKRNFKNASDRNRNKRLMREVYRKNKAGFYSLIGEQKTRIAILLHYSGKQMLSYPVAEEKIKAIIQRAAKDILQNAG
jgi:ribonuclease P protein component